MSDFQANAKPTLWPILLTVLLDMLGIGIIIPIIAPLFLDADRAVVPQDLPLTTKTFLLGLLLATFSIAQFFGSPILGALSDRVGRKKVLSWSIFGTFLGYVIFAIGILTGNVYLLFFGRFVDGISGGNIAVVFSAIADVSTPQNKTKNFGLVGMLFGVGFVLGPFIGGMLSDSSLVSWFAFDTPFWVAAFLSLLNLVFIRYNFKETLKIRAQGKLDPFSGFKNVGKAFSIKPLRIVFTVSFLMVFGFTFYTQFIQVFLIEKFSFDQRDIGYFFAYIGLWLVITQGGILRVVSKRYSPITVITVTGIGLAIALMMNIIPTSLLGLYLVAPIISIFQGLNSPNITSLVSSLAEDDNQGEILGINQSVNSLAQTLPPLIGGYLVGLNVNISVYFSSGVILIAWLVFMFNFKRKPNSNRP